MTSRERSARTKFYAVAAAAALASLALFATVGLTRREADRREPQAAPPSRPTAGIVGGADAPSTEFPWMVTLYDGDHPDDSWDGHFCGGSLISPTAVLTAAHCVHESAKPKAVVGAYNFSRADAGGASYTPERHTVKEVFIHPQYSSYPLYFNDVAVLRLETPSALPPLRIAEASPALGTNVTVIGWGQTTAVPGYGWWDDDNSTHYWDDDGTAFNATDAPDGTTYWGRGLGWCRSTLDREIYAADVGECWDNCEAAFGSDLVAVDWAFGYCYCQDDCQCLYPAYDEPIHLLTNDSITALPESCYDGGFWDDDFYDYWYDDDDGAVLCPGLPSWASCDCGKPCGDQPTFCPCAEAVACCNGAAPDVYQPTYQPTRKPSSGDDAGGAEPMNWKTKLLRRHREKAKKKAPRPAPSKASHRAKVKKKAPRPAPSKAKQAKPRHHAGRGHARAPKIAPGDDAAPSYKPSARPSYEQSSGTTSWGSDHGFCRSGLDRPVYAATLDDCWAACELTYGSIIVAVDYGERGECYCQDDCRCMMTYDGYELITVDSISELPEACEDDEYYGYWYDDDYSYDFSYWYDDDWYSSYWYDDDWYSWEDDDPDVLQLVEVAVRDPEECVLEYLPGFDICAGDPPAEDSCYGDSGGPLLVREGDAWAQVGVVSRGDGCAYSPGLYADATAMREWILSATTPAPSAVPTATPAPTSTPAPTMVTLGLVAGVNAMTGWCLDKVFFHLEDGTDFESGINGGDLRMRQDIDATTEYISGIKQFAGGACNAWLGSRVEFTVRSTATDAVRTISYGGIYPAPQGSIVFDSAVTWPCQVVGFETSPGDGDTSTLETIIRLNTSCAEPSFAPKTPPTPTQGPSPAVPAPAPTMPESSPTTRPVTPDEPLGLPESATAAPTAESDGTLGSRVAWAAAACLLAALLL